MRDLCTRLSLQGLNVELSTFSKASKIRDVSVFEKIISDLNRMLVKKKGVNQAGSPGMRLISKTNERRQRRFSSLDAQN